MASWQVMKLARGLGGPRARRPPDCLACRLPCWFPAPGLPLPAICPTPPSPSRRLARSPPSLTLQMILLHGVGVGGVVGGGSVSSCLLFPGSGGEWAVTQAQDQPTWTLWDPHQEAKTALGHLLQPLGPPIHDHDALLTIHINLVQAALGPPGHHTQHDPDGRGGRRNDHGDDESCPDKLSTALSQALTKYLI